MKIEFAVQMTCDACVKKIQNALSVVDGISKVDINLKNQSVVVESDLPQNLVKSKIEETGLKTVLKGYGLMGSAVAMLAGDTGYSTGNVKGVIRFIQEDKNTCIIDGELETFCNTSSLAPLNINIYECGDISNNCKNIGDKLFEVFKQQNIKTGIEEHKNTINDNSTNSHLNENKSNNTLKNTLSYANDLITNTKNDETCENSKINFDSITIKSKFNLDLNNVIGRSLVIEDDQNNKLACAVISRSAGVMQNKKMICACDGVTLWEEKERPPL